VSKETWEYDAVAAGNAFAAADGGWVEGMSRKNVNDAARQNLATARRHYNDPEWIVVRVQGPDGADIGSFSRPGTHEFRITLTGVDLSSYFEDGRIIKVIDGGATGAGSDLITQCDGDATYAANVTTVTTRDTIHANATDAVTYLSSVARGLALRDAETDFYIPATADAQGINNAISLADAAGGGTVLLIHPLYTIDALEGPIDLTTNGNVILQGAGPEVILRQTAGEDMDEMITLGNGSKPNIIRDFQIDVNRSNNLGGAGYGIEVDGPLRSKIQGVLFLNCQVCVKITATTMADLFIQDCYMANYIEGGVMGTGSTDNHFGQISNCLMTNVSATAVDAAAIKVAGRWNIANNRIRDIGHASNVERGIWLMTKTGSLNGGLRSSVVGNLIHPKLANGTMIQIGGSEVAVTGNYVLVPTAGKGIDVRSDTGGQTVHRVSVTGNVVNGGVACIATNDLVDDSVISGNTCSPIAGGTGIEVDGAKCLIAGNMISGGLTSINVKANSSNAVVANNLMTAATNGILVDSGATRPYCRDNSPDTTVTNNVVINEDSTIAVRNNDPLDVTRVNYTDLNVTGWSVSILAFAGVAIPGVSAVGRFACSYHIVNEASSRDGFVNLYFGPSGDITDDLVLQIVMPSASTGPAGSNDVDGTWVFETLTCSRASDVFTVEVIQDGGGTGGPMVIHGISLERIADE